MAKKGLPTHDSGKMPTGLDIGTGNRRYNPARRRGRGLPTHRSHRVGTLEDVNNSTRYSPSTSK